MRIYRSLETLPIITFWKIQKDENILLLDIDYKEGKVYSNADIAEIENVWLKMQDEYFVMQDSPESEKHLRSINEKLKLSLKLQTLQDIGNAFVYLLQVADVVDEKWFSAEKNKAYDLLKKCAPNYKGNSFKTIPEILSDISQLMKSTTNIYNERVKVLGNKAEKKIENIFKTIAKIGAAIGMQLNPHTMSVSEYIAYLQIALENGKKDQ